MTFIITHPHWSCEAICIISPAEMLRQALLLILLVFESSEGSLSTGVNILRQYGFLLHASRGFGCRSLAEVTRVTPSKALIFHRHIIHFKLWPVVQGNQQVTLLLAAFLSSDIVEKTSCQVSWICELVFGLVLWGIEPFHFFFFFFFFF